MYHQQIIYLLQKNGRFLFRMLIDKWDFVLYRTRQFESTSFTHSTFSNFSPSFFTYLDLSVSSETILRSFELKLVGYMRQLSDDLDLIDNTTHLLNVWAYMIEG